MLQNRSPAVVAASAVLLGLTSAASACDLCGVIDLPPRGGPAQYIAPQPAVTTEVPSWSSYASAPASLYIKFDGVDFGDLSWGSSNQMPGVQPAFSRDADTSTYSQTDLDAMHLIWSAVSEFYSPFNLNVTTVNPGNLNRRENTQVVVSGNGSWYGNAGGVAYLGAFQSTSTPDLRIRTGWAFEDNYNDMLGLAETVAHEAGHQFGLSHQSLFDQNGNRIDTYRDTQDGGYTDPIMGGHYQAVRSLWSDGTVGWNNGPIHQDDMEKIASTQGNPYGNYWNGFGLRADDWGNTPSEAGEMTIDDDVLRAAGVIEQVSDRDVFRFSSTGGIVNIYVDGAEFGQMLDIRIDLYDAEEAHLLTANPSLSLSPGAHDYGLDASFSGLLEAGDYFLAVGSNGAYGDVGQFFVTAWGAVAIPEPAAAGVLALAGLLLRRRSAA